MSDNILNKIVAAKREEVKFLKTVLDEERLKRDAGLIQKPVRDFRRAVTRLPDEPIPRLIAEIKPASPSRGPIRPNIEVAEWAELYQAGGANAISVLTESHYFLGKGEFIEKVKKSVTLPVLRKDFIFDSWQIYESRLLEADAILLIVAVIEDIHLLREFLQTTWALGMEALVEVHDLEELELALEAGAHIIGVNNRDLRSLKVDLNTSLNLAKHLPTEVISISESGIKSYKDVAALAEVGYHAILVGEAIMDSLQPKDFIKEILGWQND